MAKRKVKPKKADAVLKAIAVLAVAGALFSGYLTLYTFASGQPGCELFIFGMPSCFYGALMYASVFALSLCLCSKPTRSRNTMAMAALSAAGIAFAAYLTMTTLSAASCVTLEIFGLPPCTYGLLMYLALLALALLEMSRK